MWRWYHETETNHNCGGLQRGYKRANVIMSASSALWLTESLSHPIMLEKKILVIFFLLASSGTWEITYKRQRKNLKYVDAVSAHTLFEQLLFTFLFCTVFRVQRAKVTYTRLNWKLNEISASGSMARFSPTFFMARLFKRCCFHKVIVGCIDSWFVHTG